MTAATATLTDFLLARIAEDEAVARAALAEAGQFAANRWRVEWRWARLVYAHDLDIHSHQRFLHTTFAPARVLAECEAKRRIVMRHVSIDGRCLGCGMETVAVVSIGLGVLVTHCPELRYVAAVYADHPDYREEWRS